MMSIVIKCVITLSIQIKLTRVYHELIIIIEILDSIELIIFNTISTSYNVTGEIKSHFN